MRIPCKWGSWRWWSIESECQWVLHGITEWHAVYMIVTCWDSEWHDAAEVYGNQNIGKMTSFGLYEEIHRYFFWNNDGNCRDKKTLYSRRCATFKLLWCANLSMKKSILQDLHMDEEAGLCSHMLVCYWFMPFWKKKPAVLRKEPAACHFWISLSLSVCSDYLQLVQHTSSSTINLQSVLQTAPILHQFNLQHKKRMSTLLISRKNNNLLR